LAESFDLAVRGGTLVTARASQLRDLYVSQGKVALVAAPEESHPAAETVEASGFFVLPGMVDTHVHFMEPGDPSREDFATGSTAAALQGVTTVIEHTHGWPVTSLERLREKLAELRGRSQIDFGLAAHVWPDQLDQLEPLWRAGVAFFKAFTCETHGVPAVHQDRLLDLAGRLAALGAPCLVHCEDDLMTAANERRLREEMRSDGGVVPEWRSREAELVAAGTLSLIARQRRARFFLAHASNREVVDLVAAEAARGTQIAAECCPQYLRLREDEVLTHGALRKFTPPARIRSDDEETAMWEAFNLRAVNHISSDHAPATLEQKLGGDIWQVHFGLPGIDTTMPLLLDAALRGRTTLERVAEAYSTAPARAYGLSGKGSLEPGADADLAIVDPRPTRELRDEQIVSRAGWTPYAGTQVRGAVVATVLRGQVLVREGTVDDAGFSGRFVPGPGRVNQWT
jgi:dihydroorotase (multifunctional complex type)